MKEILYIQAGELSNYTGTHFWNTQESYLTLNESRDYAGIDPGVAFCENMDDKGRSTLCPRLILVDKKTNFGTLARCNTGNMGQAPEELTESLWNGSIVEYRQDLIPQSTYQSHMETESKFAEQDPHDSSPQLINGGGDIRYWSDFGRLYYLPRSLQQVPDPPEWESTDPGWIQGHETFMRHNEDTELMDGSVRLFVEECELMQGFQIMNDVDSFGSFMNSFLITLRDEYPKMASVVFPLMSSVTAQILEISRVENARQLFTEAMYLRTLNECSSMNIPIKHPARWHKSLWKEPMNFPEHSRYHQAGILSAHLETCTLPFRLKNRHEDIASVCGMLNCHGSPPFGELSGVLPLKSLTDLENNTIINFSSDIPIKSLQPYSRFDVTRGFSNNTIEMFDNWSTKISSLSSYVKRIHGPPYPVVDSFPPILGDAAGITPRGSGSSIVDTSNVLQTLKGYTSISTSSATADMFEKYALFIDKCISHRTCAVALVDISLDDLKDLANDLWTIHDNFSEDNQSLGM